MNESIQNLSKTKDQIDYGIIRDNYKDEKYNGDYKAFKTEVKNYAYLSNDGKIVSDLKVLEYAKKQIGENKKYVKLVGDGATFYILTEEGEVYIATESKNFAERYFSRKLNSMDERTLPIGSSEKTLDYLNNNNFLNLFYCI